jgi:hypothetical protein
VACVESYPESAVLSGSVGGFCDWWKDWSILILPALPEMGREDLQDTLCRNNRCGVLDNGNHQYKGRRDRAIDIPPCSQGPTT